MPDINSVLHTLKATGRPAAGILAVLVFAILGLTACGGSSKRAPSHGNAAVTSTTAAPTATVAPTSTTGSSQPSGAPKTAQPRLQRPNGPGSGSGSGSGSGRVNGPAFRLALAKFATCLRQNGVNMPAPNTSNKGPIFSTKGLKTSSPQFRTATVKCRSVLIGAFRAGR
jgi:hypothetical protein